MSDTDKSVFEFKITVIGRCRMTREEMIGEFGTLIDTEGKKFSDLSTTDLATMIKAYLDGPNEYPVTLTVSREEELVFDSDCWDSLQIKIDVDEMKPEAEKAAA